MAIVYKCTIIYVTLIIQESISVSIHRDLCLGAVVRFINHQDKCNFDLSTTEDILQDVATCPKKCSFRIDDLNPSGNFSLRKIYLTIDDERIIFTICSKSYTRRKIQIKCPSWNVGEYIILDNTYAYICAIKDAQCVSIYDHCICQCRTGYIMEGGKCLKRNLGLNESCEFTEQCIQPFSVCLHGKCKCINGYSAFDTDSCIKDTIPVGGFCNLSHQCTGSSNSGICKNGRCTCANESTLIDLACEKNYPKNLGIGSSNSQQHDTNIEVTLGLLFGGFILGVIVTAVVTTLMYKRLKFQTRKREEPGVMFVDNRTCDGASSAQISYRNDKKRNVAKLSHYSVAKEIPGYNLSSNQEDERTEDIYNHLREQTEHEDDTYDHACAVPNHSADLSDYSNIHDAAIFRTSPSKDGDDYFTLRHWASRDGQYVYECVN